MALPSARWSRPTPAMFSPSRGWGRFIPAEERSLGGERIPTATPAGAYDCPGETRSLTLAILNENLPQGGKGHGKGAGAVLLGLRSHRTDVAGDCRGRPLRGGSRGDHQARARADARRSGTQGWHEARSEGPVRERR